MPAVLFSILLLFSTTAFAEAYQSFLTVFHSSRDDSSYDASVSGMSGGYYWSPIEFYNGPLAESAFLSKASGVGFSVARPSYDFGAVQMDGSGRSVSISYVFRDQGFIISASDMKQTLTGMGPDMDSKSTGIGIGKFLSDGMLVSLSYESRTDTISGLPDNNSKSTGISIKRFVNDLNLEAGIISENAESSGITQTNDEFDIQADLYFDNTFSIGAAYSSNSGDNKNAEGTTFSINITKFISVDTSIDISYDDFSSGTAYDYSKTLSFSLSSRF